MAAVVGVPTRGWHSVGVGRSWRIEERVGTAALLHEAWPATVDDPRTRAVAICRVSAPAVVLGSTQQLSVVDGERAERSGMTVTRRRSGGGAVLVTADDPIWIDAWVPRGDRLWLDDVARAFDWIGDTWATALEHLGIVGVSVHRGGLSPCTPWSSLVCFGGVGTGEVLDSGGRKVVGIAQRRTRDGAWFHSACLRRWDPDPLLDVLVLEADERRAAHADLTGAVVGIDDLLSGDLPTLGMGGQRVVDEFVGALPLEA
jgi:lipoate-protein ligase A